MNHAKREEFRQQRLCRLQCLRLQYLAGLQSNMSTVLSTQVALPMLFAQVLCLHVCMYMYLAVYIYLAVRVKLRVNGPSFTCTISRYFPFNRCCCFRTPLYENTSKPRDSPPRQCASCPPGNFSEGVWHGRGTLLASGDVYRGNWHQSLRHGQGDQVGTSSLICLSHSLTEIR